MSTENSHPFLTIHRAHARIRLQLDDELGTFHGIDFDDFALLHALAKTRDAPVALASVAAELGVSRSVLLRRLRPLEKIGLVACQGSLKDCRVVLRSPGLSLIKTAQDTVTRVCARASVSVELKTLADAGIETASS